MRKVFINSSESGNYMVHLDGFQAASFGTRSEIVALIRVGLSIDVFEWV